MQPIKICLIILGLLFYHFGYSLCAPPQVGDEEDAVDRAAAPHQPAGRARMPAAAAAAVREVATPPSTSRVVEAVAVPDRDKDRNKDEQPPQKPPQARQPPKIKEVVDAPAPPRRRSSWPEPRLADLEPCAATVRHLCSHSVLDNNFAVLDCLQRDQSVADRVPSGCQHEVWRLKFNLTHNVKFDLAANGACQEDLQRLSVCSSLQPGQGLRVSCLIEHKREIKSPDCVALLSRLEPIVFSDYRMVQPFAKACAEDVQRLKCGRLGAKPASETDEVESSLPKSQGKTIACLSKMAGELAKNCRRQLLRLAELQSDDYHNDRQLFYACREDRERLCARVTSGDGRVFSCLGKQSPSSLSDSCKAELKRVHQLMQYDYQVEHRFAQACQDDLDKHKCELGSEEDSKEHGMVRALLCLENAIMTKGAESVDTECKRQMLKVRTEYLSEPGLDPLLTEKCASQIEFCRKEATQEQQLLHCIMNQVQASTNPGTVAECGAAVARLLRVAMPTRNLQVDPVLTESCRGELDSKCAGSQHKNGYVCLKSLLASDPDSVGRDCGDRLAELEYFENRDFKLNDRLYRACRQPAASLCNASKDWFQTDRDQGYQPAAAVYNCLFHHIHKGKTSDSVPQACSNELIRSLEERANRVKLDPRLYEHCITDLSTKCMKDPGAGQEFRCLQDKMPELSESCRAAVRELTAAASRDIRLSPDTIMVRSCLPFAQTHCNTDTDSVSDDSVMECLIRLLKHPDMPDKCRAGVAHHQLIALEDVDFSHAFSQACGETITVRCPGVATKKDAVRCLSDMVRNDTLTEQKQRVPAKCRAKLTLEMLQRSQSLNLDPRLQRACKADLEGICAGSKDPLACLKDNVRQLSPRCHRRVFRRQKMQMDMPNYDAKLMKRCRAMINKHCSQKASIPTELFTCLRERMHDEDFDNRCRRIINKRLRVQQTDIELNPDLQRACRQDITRHCTKELKAAGDNRFKSTQDQLHNTVMQCLRRVNSEGKQLRGKCHRYLRDMLFEYNMNYRLEPRLAHACKPVVEQLCQEEAADAGPDTAVAGSLLSVTECLKQAAAQDRIPKEHKDCRHEVMLLFRDVRADIHVDPVLYQACSFEIRNLCRGVPLGNGQQMSCAVSLFKDSQANQMISKNCRDRLKERVDLMEAAFKVAPPESLREVMTQMSVSPSRMYFLLVGLLLVLGLLVVGVCAGRVTKRVRVDMKNR